ncbi:MAG: hypothetical protein ACJAVM_001953 [Sulfitobacter sp.]|jgi:hypothetical protein
MGTKQGGAALGLCNNERAPVMRSIIYLVGLVVIILFILRLAGFA